MKGKLASIAIALLAVSSSAWAGDSPISILAKEAGLSERKVQMILGTRTAFAEYPYTYDRSVAKLRRAIGTQRYDQLMNEGEFIAAAPEAKAEALLAALHARTLDHTP